MGKLPVVIDLETKYTFRDYKDHRKLGVSVVGIYDYATDNGSTFMEDELHKLFSMLEGASRIVGFNIDNFDLPVLQAYYPGKLSQFKTFDILDDIREKIQKRVPLNELVFATLGKKKSGHGLMAIDYYKEKKFEKLKSYCLDDVMLTKELFDYGISHGEVFYRENIQKTSIPVNWKKYMEDGGDSNTALTLPF